MIGFLSSRLVSPDLEPSTLNNTQHSLGGRRSFVKYAIIGSGKIGTALARIFARKNIEVALANSRGPKTLASLREELGPSVVPQSLQDSCNAEMIFLAVPFRAHKDIAKQLKQWNGRIVVDLTNAFHVAPEELGGVLSSEIVSQAFAGARVVKAFNHLPAAQLGTNPSLDGQRQAVFISSNDADAANTVASVAAKLGFAPVELGRLDNGGVPLHVVGGKPGGLLFQNLAKLS
jgi:8-hydroxy-5-deazaflavin:NADPH oxidoreductase